MAESPTSHDWSTGTAGASGGLGATTGSAPANDSNRANATQWLAKQELRRSYIVDR